MTPGKSTIILLRCISVGLAMNMENTEIIVFIQTSVGLAMNLENWHNCISKDFMWTINESNEK